MLCMGKAISWLSSYQGWFVFSSQSISNAWMKLGYVSSPLGLYPPGLIYLCVLALFISQ
ncbi:hypothetical protein BDV26DRAFT_273970 [Aspergillus bertholletiae]|uniref:Uncharacterized protein n=1 Tax=Aspergillus bertholletiae TaxID=1226010 RepID=A0A5N7ARR8_9EURO|nr:hypothetical protein BDV26DRAFT_273970 [Aspergillus bertholletiae]